MLFNNFENISKKAFRQIVKLAKQELISYNLRKNYVLEVFYNYQKDCIRITNYNEMDVAITKLFEFSYVINEYIVTPRDKKIIKELSLDTNEKLNKYYEDFKENYEKEHLISIEIPLKLYRGLKPDYFEYDDAIYELCTKEEALKKLRDDIKLYKKTIKEIKSS